MKLKATDGRHYGKTLNLPGIGTVQVGDDGLVEGDHDAGHCQIIATGNVGFEIVKDATDEGDDDAPITAETIEAMNEKELRKICKEAKLPVKHWSKLDEAGLKAYLIETLVDADDEETK